MRRKILDVFTLLTQGEIKRVSMLLILTTVFVFFEVFGVSLVPLYISWIVTPAVTTSPSVFEIVGFDKTDSVPIGVVITLIVVFGTYVSYWIIKNIIFLSQEIGARISSDLYHGFLDNDEKEDQSDLINKVTLECDRFASFILTPIFFIFSRAVLAISLVTVLLVYNYVYSLPVFIVIFILFFLIFMKSRKDSYANGRLISDSSSQRLHEIKSIYALKEELILYNKIDSVMSRYSALANMYAKSRSSVEVIAKQPRYIFESVVLGGGVLLALVLSGNQKIQPLEFMLMFGVVGYKLMPAIHQLQSYFSVLQGNINAYDEIKLNLQHLSLKSNVEANDEGHNLDFSNGMIINRLSVTYDDGVNVYRDIEFKPGLIYCLVGPSGSGKSTLLKVISGFSNNVTEFNVSINEKTISWNAYKQSAKKNVAYLPQNSVVYGKTISESIFLEKGAEGKDSAFYKYPWSFSRRNFQDKYLDEQLSGGECQRLNIARCLYYSRGFYVFDESMSGIDRERRALVWKDIKSKADNGAIVVVVSHDPGDLGFADKIIDLSIGGLN